MKIPTLFGLKILAWMMIAFLSACEANAGIIATYANKASFINATNSVSATGILPMLGSVGPNVTIGNANFNTTAFPTTTDIAVDQFSTLIQGNELALSGSENMNVSLSAPSPVTSFGFEIHEPSRTRQLIDGTNTPFFHDSTFTISLFQGASLVDQAMLQPANDVLVFFGLETDMAFDRVSITEDLAGSTYISGNASVDMSNDNEFFGEFLIGSVSSTVPEPTSALTFCLVALSTVFVRRARANVR